MLHHLLVPENLLFHLLQPIFGAPFFDWSLQIFLAEDTVLDMKDLGVLLHLCEVRIMTLMTNLSLGELGEAMAPKPAKSFPGRNRPREKTHEIARYSARTIRPNI